MLLTAALILGLASASRIPHRSEKRQGTVCAELTAPEVDGASVTSISTVENGNICEVYIYLTHIGSNDNVSVITFLPIDNWNGRYQGTGGSGFSTGGDKCQLSGPSQAGWAVGTTDGGLPHDSNSTNFAFNPQLKQNFAYLSIHDMTVAGKAVAAQFYGRPPAHAYWNGCSTAGGQGYTSAQRYPGDYDGIYAGSPPLDYSHLQVSQLWPFVVQNAEDEFVPSCVFDTLTEGAVALCDIDDGATDGIVADPPSCQANATVWVGYPAVACDDGGETVITEEHAKIWNKIAYGPVDTNGNWLYSGIPKGASYSGETSSTPEQDASGFIRAWVLNDTSFDLSSISYSTFPGIFNLAYQEQNALLGANNHDLTPFHQAGGKLLSWHGWADASASANATAGYWAQVQQTMASVDVGDFYRLFLAPGVGHCGGGYGAEPVDGFGALVAWVENGTVPETLPASGNGLARNLCAYPSQLHYTGTGDVNAAESWTCI
ncbi:feruloyl esterase B [Pestalotiopsis sp. NC0098]|nr:feruloyl esterase B [Pestalotiopsis sp. NC0098]